VVPGEVLERPISKEQVIARFLALKGDPRFRDFAGKIEINEYGDLLANVASRLHVVVQKRLAAYLEQHLGGEAMGEMPVEVTVQQGNAIRLRVPDIVWSAVPGFFDGPPELKILPRPPELCVEVKSTATHSKTCERNATSCLLWEPKKFGSSFLSAARSNSMGPRASAAQANSALTWLNFGVAIKLVPWCSWTGRAGEFSHFV
jgi:Putative restriction endonuclease